MPTPAKPSLRQRYKALEEFNTRLRVNSENATFVANAMFWKLGLTNRGEIKAIVDAFMEHMKLKVAAAKEQGSLQVLPNFVDPAILAKVAEHADSTTTDS